MRKFVNYKVRLCYLNAHGEPVFVFCFQFEFWIKTTNLKTFIETLLDDMARLTIEMHPLLTQEVLELLFAKSIYTVSEFIETDTKQLSNVMRFAMKARFVC